MMLALRIILIATVVAYAAPVAAQSRMTVRVANIDYRYADCITRKFGSASARTVLDEAFKPNSWPVDGKCYFEYMFLLEAYKLNGGSIVRRPRIIKAGLRRGLSPNRLPGGGMISFRDIDSFLMMERFLYIPTDLYRGALAVSLVRREYVAGGPASFNGLPPLRHPAYPARSTPVADGTTFEDQFRDAFASRIGECIARANPARAKAFVHAEAMTDQPVVNAQVKPLIEGCLPDGDSATVSATVIRGGVATAYYRMAKQLKEAAK
ncbi:hypothetical protein [Sphingomonas sp. LT1P40]|uniref:hypothetical protein n=1 Tax=Alteristakelama amylovorans TaxID=3096166 RepID=UPI002FC69547